MNEASLSKLAKPRRGVKALFKRMAPEKARQICLTCRTSRTKNPGPLHEMEGLGGGSLPLAHVP